MKKLIINSINSFVNIKCVAKGIFCLDVLYNSVSGGIDSNFENS